MQIDRDFSEFVESFVAHDVRFLVVGGYALAAHGLPRATGDFDAWVWIDPTNAARIVAALDDFGFGSVGLRADDFLTPDFVVQLGFPPLRIDIITEIDGVQFDLAWDRRIIVDAGGIALPVIGRDDLIDNKRAAGRPQDLVDVARLLDDASVQKDDWSGLAVWPPPIQVTDVATHRPGRARRGP